MLSSIDSLTFVLCDCQNHFSIDHRDPPFQTTRDRPHVLDLVLYLLHLGHFPCHRQMGGTLPSRSCRRTHPYLAEVTNQARVPCVLVVVTCPQSKVHLAQGLNHPSGEIHTPGAEICWNPPPNNRTDRAEKETWSCLLTSSCHGHTHHHTRDPRALVPGLRVFWAQSWVQGETPHLDQGEEGANSGMGRVAAGLDRGSPRLADHYAMDAPEARQAPYPVVQVVPREA